MQETASQSQGIVGRSCGPDIPGDPRLPIEVFEKIIDSCARFPDAERDVKDGYSCLCSCACVCKAWVPRSRLNLYNHIKIIGSLQFNKFFATLNTSSYGLGDLVHRLSIAVNLLGPGRFLPAGTVIVALCRKLRKLDRLDIIYTSVRPHDSFFVCAAQYRTVTVLSLSGYSFADTKDLVKFIVLFPELRALKVVHDDYDPPTSSVVRRALYHVELPHLVALQIELVHTRNVPLSSDQQQLDVSHLIVWLARSTAARHLRTIWIVVTVESSDEGRQAAARINGLLQASGDSLQDLVIAMRITSEVERIWEISNLEGLSLRHNPNLKNLYLFQMPWRIISRVIPSLVASSNPCQLGTVTLTFYPEEKWPAGTLTDSPLHEYGIFTAIDTTLGNRCPAFREFVVDPNGLAGVDGRRKLLESLPKMRSKGLVHLRPVDGNRLRAQWGLP